MWFRKRSAGAAGEGDAGPADDATGVLMVCMGNICRSPTAEGVLRAKLRQAGLQRRVWVDSAGTHGSYHEAEPPDARAIRHAAQRGYDIAGLRARAVHATDFERFRWMLAMDQSNLRWLRQNAPRQGTPRIELLLGGVSGLGIDEVPDPYYGPADGFERVLDLVEQACDAFVLRLLAEGGPGPGATR
jgi:protein-tyrosine phosphatase